MEKVVTMPFADCYCGKNVLLTGHTGFKGSWLAEWLLALGAKVTGFSLAPPTEPALFDQLGLAPRLRHVTGDIRDAAALRQVVSESRPDFVFHLAAQSLVRRSYAEPVETYATNVMGTAHLLEAVRILGQPCTVVVVTTDKCYENREWVHSYREEDALGGYDPYSSSKGAAELVVSAYRRSYFSAPEVPIFVASARAGNVIGGGDWAVDRIVPDCIRALQGGKTIAVRNKHATRPWQHVLEPLSGYLWLASCLARRQAQPGFSAGALSSAFNFGPGLEANRPVVDLVQAVLRHWPGSWDDQSNPQAVHEAQRLNLATDKAYHLLQWKTVWDFEEALARTIAWYSGQFRQPADAAKIVREQISDYTAAAAIRHIAWAG